MKKVHKSEIFKKFISSLFIFLLIFNNILLAQTEQVVIGASSGDASAVLHLDISTLSSPKGFLAPRMTTTQRNSITSPANGLVIFNTTNNYFEYNAGTSGSPQWVTLLNSNLTGDASISSSTLTLANTGTASGTFGSTTLIPILAIDSKGRITYAGSTTFSSISSSLNSGNIYVGNASNVATAVSISGDASLDNTGALTLTNTGVASGTIGSSSAIPILAVDSKGRLSYAGSTTFSSLSPTLNSANIYVGNASNVATGVAISGDISINNSGSVSLVNTGTASGTFGSTNQIPIIAVDSKGRITYVGSTSFSTSSASISLEQAYNSGGSGNGRTISVNNGAVNFVGSNASDYTLRVSNSSAGGGVFINNTSTGNALAVTNGSSTYMLIDNAGKLSLGTNTSNELLTIDGNVSLKKGSAPTSTSNYGKLYVNSSDAQLYYVDDTGNSNLLTNDYGIFDEQISSGLDAGSFPSSKWVDRDVNTTNSIKGSSITRSGGTFTLTAGTYRVVASAPAYRVNGHQIRLYNITDGTADLTGTSAYSATISSNSYDGNSTLSLIDGIITVASTKSFDIQHRCTKSNLTDGLGRAANVGTNEVYTKVYIKKIK